MTPASDIRSTHLSPLPDQASFRMHPDDRAKQRPSDLFLLDHPADDQDTRVAGDLLDPGNSWARDSDSGIMVV
jgi:hypothetical protein